MRVERVDDGTADNGATDFGGATEEHSGRLLAPFLAAPFMAQLDTFIVNLAAPAIRTEPGASGAGLQLVVAGYTISYDVLLIIGTRLVGPLGHDRAHLAGLADFTAASFACGLAVDAGQLIAFQLVQGVGAAVMVPKRSWFRAGSSWWLSLQWLSGS